MEEREGTRFKRQLYGWEPGETDAWELRTCRCGYTRKVKIRRTRIYLVEFEWQRQPQGYLKDVEIGREFLRAEESYTELCLACVDMQRAAQLEAQAARLRKRAEAIYNKRLRRAHAQAFPHARQGGE